MFGNLLVKVIENLPATIAAVATLIVALKNRKTLKDVGAGVNGRLNQLLDTTADAKRAQGHLEGRAEAKAEMEVK